MKTLRLPYGNEFYELNINKDFDILQKEELVPITNPRKELMRQYDNPISSKPLKELIKDKKDIIIAVSDKTRPIPYKVILNDALLPYLYEQGFDDKNISFIIANGSHDLNLEKDKELILGKDIANKYDIYFNNCYEENDFVDIGYEKRGVKVKLNKYFVKADFKILTGLINPHIYAGFSGGRKSVVPGLCNTDCWKLIHGVELMDHPGTRLGNLKNNLLHEIGTEVSRKVKVDFIINIALNSENKVSGVYCGDLEKAFELGVDQMTNKYKIKIEKKYDILITHGGGYPLDSSFYQIIKGMSSPLPYLRENGEIICIASCMDGIGTQLFVDLLKRIKSLKNWRTDLEKRDYQMEQWTVQAYYNLFKKAKVFLFSPQLFKKEPFLQDIVNKIDDIQYYIDEKITKNPEIKIGVFLDGPYCI